MSNRKRACIPLKVQLAAALSELMHLRGQGIPFDVLKSMSAAQYLSLFHLDHTTPHVWTKNDHFSNLSFLYIREHREKTKSDVKAIAKVRRGAKKQEEFRAMCLRKAGQVDSAPLPERKPFRKRWPSRPFPGAKSAKARRGANVP